MIILPCAVSSCSISPSSCKSGHQQWLPPQGRKQGVAATAGAAAPGLGLPAVKPDDAGSTAASSSQGATAVAGGVLETTADTNPAAVSAAERDDGQVPKDTHVPAISANGDPQDVEYVVCWEAEAGVVFQPCGHCVHA